MNDQLLAASEAYDVPERKRTSLDLYLSAGDAYDLWKVSPGRVTIIDVRTPEEYIFVGHAAMARNIPLLFIEYRWDVDKDEPEIRPNPDFIAFVKEHHSADDTLALMCRSGGRSALAVNALAKAGFTKVFNVFDGFEGDTVAEEGSAYLGKRLKNGWKNSGAPWTYACDTELLWIANEE